LRQVFIRVYRLVIQSVVLVFSTQLCELLPVAPLTLSLVQLSSPLPSVKVQYVWLGGGWGVLSPVEDHILQEFNTLYLTIFRTYKIARPPETKTLEGRGPQTDKHLPQSPFTGQIFRMTTFYFKVSIYLISPWVRCSSNGH
jgi:hypothetical protein